MIGRKHSYIIAFWSPYALHTSHYYLSCFSRLLKEYGDFQWLDCKDHFDNRTLKLLRQADLVVIVITQNYEKISSFLCERNCRFERFIYMVVDYIPCHGWNKEILCHTFRIPDNQMICLPYNSMFQESIRLGTEREFLGRCLNEDKTGNYNLGTDLDRELKRCIRIILKILETEVPDAQASGRRFF